jgi:hypothetical protein
MAAPGQSSAECERGVEKFIVWHKEKTNKTSKQPKLLWQAHGLANTGVAVIEADQQG